MEKDKIKELFGSALNDLKVEPPKEVWEAILAGRKPKRRLLYFYRIATAAAVLVLLISIPLWLIQPIKDNLNNVSLSEKPQNEEIKNTIKGTNTPKNEIIASETLMLAETQPKQKANTIRTNSSNKVLSNNKTNSQNELSNNSEKVQNSNNTESAIAENELSSIDADSAIESDEIAEDLTLKVIPNPEDFIDDFTSEISKTKPSINFALAYGSYSDGALNSNDLSYSANNSSFSLDSYDSEVAYETTFFEEIDYTEARPPVSLAFKVNLGLNKRLSFESGLIYTQLSTITKTIEINESYSEYKRSLYYIGIPLGLTFDILRGKNTLVYIQQSVIIEKGIRAISTTSRYEFQKRVESDQSKITITGMQISTLTSAGLDLNLFNNVSAFGEGGIQVFYLNQTQPFNIRSAKMLWPVFQTGIRLKI